LRESFTYKWQRWAKHFISETVWRAKRPRESFGNVKYVLEVFDVLPEFAAKTEAAAPVVG
jgi:hypothetical protein